MDRKEEYKSLIDECLDEECDCKHWCLLKEVVIASFKFDKRFLIQAKAVEIFKLNKSKPLPPEKALSWDDAWFLWADEGWAKKFDEVYKEYPNKGPKAIYKIMFNEKQ